MITLLNSAAQGRGECEGALQRALADCSRFGRQRVPPAQCGLRLLKTQYRQLPFQEAEIVAAEIHRGKVTPVFDARRLVPFPTREHLEVVKVGQGVLQVLGERAQRLATARLFGVLWAPVFAQQEAAATPLMRTSAVDV